MKIKKDERDERDNGGSSMELVCVRACDIPGVREFQPGDKMSDPELVEKFKDNPNFKPVTAEEKKR